MNVPATELFPIHHVDDLEFFPCDFVASSSGKAVTDKCEYEIIKGKIEGMCMLY